MPYFSFKKADDVISVSELKSLRERINVSQRSLARIFGISVKTVEKWESGDNPIKGTAAKLIYILNKQPELIDLIYSFELTDPNKGQLKKEKTQDAIEVNE
jgi:putative transcriptional regulator